MRRTPSFSFCDASLYLLLVFGAFTLQVVHTTCLTTDPPWLSPRRDERFDGLLLDD